MNRRSFLKVMAIGAASVSVSQCKFGEAEQSDEDILWELFMFSGTYWGNATHVAISRERFNAAIRSRQTDNAFDQVIQAYKNDLAITKNKEKTLENLYFGSVLPDDVKERTIRVFITLNLMHGGFKIWGLKNYPGFMGGSFYVDNAKTPYRSYES